MSANRLNVKPDLSSVVYSQSYSDVFRSDTLNVAAGGWFIVGRPTLWQLLKHWWRNRP